MTPTCAISVVICTWNRADLLDQTLAGLCQLRVPPTLDWELLVINNRSTDHTPRILEKYTQTQQLPLRVLDEPQQGLSHARNRGQAAARGAWVLWTDDDVLVEPDWLTTFAAIVARHPTAAAIGGQVEPWFPIDPDPDLLAVFAPLRNGYCGVNFGPDERLVAEHEMFVGALMAYRQDAVRGLQFDPNLGRNGNFLGGGEDYRYQVQVNERGGERIWAPSLRLRHYVDPSRMTLDYARKYYFDLRHGAIHDDDRAPRLAGVPRWLFKQYGWAVVRQWGNRLLGRRRAHLQGLVDTWKYANLIRSYRAQV